MKNFWFKTALIIFVLLLIGYFAPEWNLFSPKKLVSMILALVIIQALGIFLIKPLGTRAGSIVTGFLGGLISSTAMTASIARKSKNLTEKETVTESLGFLSATLAMLVEALFIVAIGSNGFASRLLLIFLGPMLITFALIFVQSKKDHARTIDLNKDSQIEILPILKLSFFILLILTLSKLLQKAFGQSGLLVLTFLVSLFEIHGSFIANVQLFDSGTVDLQYLGALLSLSLAASYISKFFLVFLLGGSILKRQTAMWTSLILLSLFVSWLSFNFYH